MSRLENLVRQYSELIVPPRKMTRREIERASMLLDRIVQQNESLYGILSSVAQQAPEHMSVDEAFLYAFNHPAVKGYLGVAA